MIHVTKVTHGSKSRLASTAGSVAGFPCPPNTPKTPVGQRPFSCKLSLKLPFFAVREVRVCRMADHARDESDARLWEPLG